MMRASLYIFSFSMEWGIYFWFQIFGPKTHNERTPAEGEKIYDQRYYK